MTDFTHDAAATSWVDSANSEFTDFPIQNLPYGKFRRVGSNEAFRIGVAIGDQILDLVALADVDPSIKPLLGRILEGDLNGFMALEPSQTLALRYALFKGIQTGSNWVSKASILLIAQSDVEMAVPCRIGDYTDFYTGIYHATTVGKLFRPDNPLLPNYKWVPIGYHGRSSSIGVSGQAFPRPRGQTKGEGDAPTFAPSKRMDYELELGFFVGTPNKQGEAVNMDRAEEALFGATLLNDWSARDVQAWEYQPLGPFLAKNFATTISPWIVTMHALEPFRVPFTRDPGDPQPLPYLDSDANRKRGGINIGLEVWLQTKRMRDADTTAVAHHASNGCNLQPGDLLGSGTQSGPNPGEGGSLLELSSGGKAPLNLGHGEMRTFLEDGDTVILKGRCTAPGIKSIGFGDCVGTLLAPLDT
jgi:fumarylacetoacetase